MKPTNAAARHGFPIAFGLFFGLADALMTQSWSLWLIIYPVVWWILWQKAVDMACFTAVSPLARHLYPVLLGLAYALWDGLILAKWRGVFVIYPLAWWLFGQAFFWSARRLGQGCAQ